MLGEAQRGEERGAGIGAATNPCDRPRRPGAPHRSLAGTRGAALAAIERAGEGRGALELAKRVGGRVSGGGVRMGGEYRARAAASRFPDQRALLAL
jgi:hypothetical protein